MRGWLPVLAAAALLVAARGVAAKGRPDPTPRAPRPSPVPTLLASPSAAPLPNVSAAPDGPSPAPVTGAPAASAPAFVLPDDGSPYCRPAAPPSEAPGSPEASVAPVIGDADTLPGDRCAWISGYLFAADGTLVPWVSGIAATFAGWDDTSGPVIDDGSALVASAEPSLDPLRGAPEPSFVRAQRNPDGSFTLAVAPAGSRWQLALTPGPGDPAARPNRLATDTGESGSSVLVDGRTRLLLVLQLGEDGTVAGAVSHRELDPLGPAPTPSPELDPITTMLDIHAAQRWDPALLAGVEALSAEPGADLMAWIGVFIAGAGVVGFAAFAWWLRSGSHGVAGARPPRRYRSPRPRR